MSTENIKSCGEQDLVQTQLIIWLRVVKGTDFSLVAIKKSIYVLQWYRLPLKILVNLNPASVKLGRSLCGISLYKPFQILKNIT